MNDLTLEQAIAVLAVDSPNEEIDEFVICCAKTKLELEAIIEAEDNGEMDDEETEESIAGILMEHSDRAMDIFDLDMEAEYEEETHDYVANFSEGLSSIFAGLLEAEYENPLDGIEDVASATGVTSDVIHGVINGDVVPDPVMADRIAGVFHSLQDEQAYKEWNDLTSRAYGELLNEYEAEAEPNQGQDIETQRALATMSAQQNHLVAEFNEMKSEASLYQELRVLNKQAQDLVEQTIITPHERAELLGAFDDTEDSVALFSQACNLTGTPPNVQLDRIKYYLHMKQRSGQPNSLFSEESDGDNVAPYALSQQDQEFVKEIMEELI